MRSSRRSLLVVLAIAVLGQGFALCSEVFDAIQARDSDKVLALLKADPKLARQKNEYGDEPVDAAVREDLVPVVDALISQYGVDSDHYVPKEGPLLHSARSPEMASLLVAKHANPSGKDKSDRTALHKAPSRAVAEVLLAAGARIDEQDGEGNTPLHAAIERRRIEVIRYLLEKGADLGKKNNDGLTPLGMAKANAEAGNDKRAQEIVAAVVQEVKNRKK